MVRNSRRPKDPSKPHRGTSRIEEAKITVKAFIAGFAESDIDGDNIRRGDQRALIEVNLAEQTNIDSSTDFSEFDEIIDQTRRWRIERIEAIELGTTVLAFKAVLRA